jgi:hypothetical protein
MIGVESDGATCFSLSAGHSEGIILLALKPPVSDHWPYTTFNHPTTMFVQVFETHQEFETGDYLAIHLL